jgi:hypothetical protein
MTKYEGKFKKVNESNLIPDDAAAIYKSDLEILKEKSLIQEEKIKVLKFKLRNVDFPKTIDLNYVNSLRA